MGNRHVSLDPLAHPGFRGGLAEVGGKREVAEVRRVPCPMCAAEVVLTRGVYGEWLPGKCPACKHEVEA